MFFAFWFAAKCSNIFLLLSGSDRNFNAGFFARFARTKTNLKGDEKMFVCSCLYGLGRVVFAVSVLTFVCCVLRLCW